MATVRSRVCQWWCRTLRRTWSVWCRSIGIWRLRFAFLWGGISFWRSALTWWPSSWPIYLLVNLQGNRKIVNSTLKTMLPCRRECTISDGIRDPENSLRKRTVVSRGTFIICRFCIWTRIFFIRILTERRIVRPQ